jgi:tRNA pseudouridine32 synthase/23S rRNA pseudouridine746 synthase
LEILFADEAMLVINKPSGLRSIPDGYIHTLPTVQSELESEWGKLFIIHRLDKDTSGIMVLGRTADAHRNLNRQFAERRVVKVYHALCAGVAGWEDKVINLPLRPNGDRSHRTVVDQLNGRPASTHLHLIRQYDTYCLVEARPNTGYTHQIRTHCSVIGLPLLGDPLYKIPRSFQGVPPDLSLSPPFQRTALHAWILSIFHPVSGEKTMLHAPYPDDFKKLIVEK